MSWGQTVDETHQRLARMFAAKKFEPFIRYIRFPHFRNLREGTRIDFNHPITALVGPNGTNKTAILRALQGCPDYYNVGQYWFSTELDPIAAAERHRFIHGYFSNSSGTVVEVIKTRIVKGSNPDYFEPSRPLLQDGMSRMPAIDMTVDLPEERTATRWKAIKKDVVYLDFRSELSAYDKYFYHLPFRTRLRAIGDKRRSDNLTEKKSVVRRRSKHLATSLRNSRKQHFLYQRSRIAEPAKTLSLKQREAISDILGREYREIRVIKHRYFDVDGATVVLTSGDLEYSEAFAGSGEFSVAVLVLGVTEAKERSLILLDEPEVSLHPGAQRKLMAFLAEQCKLHGHQIVISTHSPEIVRDLPPQAIKVFLQSPTDGKIELLGQSSDASDAFFRLGVRPEQQKNVYVEDGLAAAIVRRAMRPMGEAAYAQVAIVPLPGGTNSIQTRFIPAFALAGHDRSLVLLDGDQRPDQAVADSSAIADASVADMLATLLHGEVQLSPSGNSGMSAPGEKLAQQRKILQWITKHVDYLPGGDPESLLMRLERTTLLAGSAEAKAEWERRTRAALGRTEYESVTAQEILGEQERLLAKINDEAPEFAFLRERIRRFIQEGNG